jgi:K+-sensing histidine kinase KdpD
MKMSKRTCVRVLAGYLAVVAVAVGAVAVVASGWVAATAVGVACVGAGALGVYVFSWVVDALYAEQEQHRQAVFAADLSTLSRLREASQIREDLIASVSHEFRTPLTAIRGSAATLVQRYEQLDRDAQEDLLVGILESSDRLSRLLEDMLVAASASVNDAGAIADVSSAVTRFSPSPPKFSVQLDIDPHLGAFIDGGSLTQVVTALGEHVRDSARKDRSVFVEAHRDTDNVLVSVSYTASDERQDLQALLDPFASDEPTRTGRPASLALYVVRRLVEAHGGAVTISARGEQRSIELALRALGYRTSPERGPAEPLPPRSTAPTSATRPR